MRSNSFLLIITLLTIGLIASSVDRVLLAATLECEQTQEFSEDLIEKDLENEDLGNVQVASPEFSHHNSILSLSLYYRRQPNHSGWRASGILLPELDSSRGPPLS